MALNDETEMVFAEDVEVDPVSGNEVPPGSMPEEVRDDIDARLSEGEYVVPADVLRYYGLKFFEDLRAKAKMDLARMDREGRIGGQPVEERAEGLPFMVSELEVTEVPEMAAGGLYDNINARKKAGTSRSKEDSTISDEAYAKMKRGFDSGGDAGQSTIQDWYDNWLKDNSVTKKMSDSNKISTVPFINEEGKVIYVQYRGAYDPLSPETNALSAIPTGYTPKPADAADAGASSDISDAKPDMEYGGEMDELGMVPGSVGSKESLDNARNAFIDYTIDPSKKTFLDTIGENLPLNNTLAFLDKTLSGGGTKFTRAVNRARSDFAKMVPGTVEYNKMKDRLDKVDAFTSYGKDKYSDADSDTVTGGYVNKDGFIDASVPSGNNSSQNNNNNNNTSSTTANPNQGLLDAISEGTGIDFSGQSPGQSPSASQSANPGQSGNVNDDPNSMYKGGVAKKYTEPKKPKYTKGGFVSRRTKK